MDQPVGHQRSALARVRFGAFHQNVNDDPTFFPDHNCQVFNDTVKFRLLLPMPGRHCTSKEAAHKNQLAILKEPPAHTAQVQILLDVRDPDAVHAANVRVSEVVVIGGRVAGMVKRQTMILVPVRGFSQLVGHIELPPKGLLEAVVRALDIFMRFSSLWITRVKPSRTRS